MIMAKSSKGLPAILGLIAAIIIIVQAIMNIINPSWGGIVFAILGILLGVVVLMSTGYITDKLGIPFNLITCIIFAILSFVFASWWGGIVLVIAAILILLGK